MTNPKSPVRESGHPGGNRLVVGFLALSLLLMSIDRLMDVWNGPPARVVLYIFAQALAAIALAWVMFGQPKAASRSDPDTTSTEGAQSP